MELHPQPKPARSEAIALGRTLSSLIQGLLTRKRHPVGMDRTAISWPTNLIWAWGYLGFSVALLALSVPIWCSGLIAAALLSAIVTTHDGGLEWTS